MEQSSDASPYLSYLRQLGDEISDLDLERRREILWELSTHLEDADEALSASVPDPAVRARQVQAEFGDIRELALQLGETRTRPTARLQRILVPIILAGSAAGHLAASIAFVGFTGWYSLSPLALVSGAVYLALSLGASVASFRYARQAISHPFRAFDSGWLLASLPAALLLAFTTVALAWQGSSVTIRLQDLSRETFGVLNVGLALAGAAAAVALRQRRWLVLWAGGHGALLAASPVVIYTLLDKSNLQYLAGSPLGAILLLPWIYGGAALLLGFPLGRLLPWSLVFGVGGLAFQLGVLGHGDRMPAHLLPSLFWIWAEVLPLPFYGWRMWRWTRGSEDPGIGNTTATFVLVPVPLGAALLLLEIGVSAEGPAAFAWGTAKLLLIIAALLWLRLLHAFAVSLISRWLGRPRRA